MEQRREQLEQTKRTTPNDTDEDTERSTRAVVSGFPPDTTEATIRKFLQDVITKGALTGQVSQIRCTTDPTTHASLMFNAKLERKLLRKKVAMQPTRGRRKHLNCIQIQEDLSWEERMQPQTAWTRKEPHPQGDEHRTLTDLHRQQNQIT